MYFKQHRCQQLKSIAFYALRDRIHNQVANLRARRLTVPTGRAEMDSAVDARIERFVDSLREIAVIASHAGQDFRRRRKPGFIAEISREDAFG